MVSTAAAKQEALSYDNPAIIPILQGQYLQIRALVAHPLLSQFVVAGDSGLIQIWDYNTKQVVCSRSFERHAPPPDSHSQTEKAAPVNPLKYQIYSLAYSNSGETLAVGFGNGTIRLLDSQLIDLPQTIYGSEMGHSISDHPINRIAFSPDGNYCAVSDTNHILAIVHKESVKVKANEEEEDPLFGTSNYKAKDDSKTPRTRSARQRMEWIVFGRAKPHFKDIVGKFI
jgi:WD40 repeat protein